MLPMSARPFLRKIPADPASIIYIRTGAVSELIPDFLRHIKIAPDPTAPQESDLKQFALCVITDGINVGAAEAKVYGCPIPYLYLVFRLYQFDHTSFIIVVFRDDSQVSFPF